VSKAAYPYPPDEFDASPGPDMPRGVHRAPRSAWSRWWPFLAVLVVVPALAWGAVTVLANGGFTLPGSGAPTPRTTTTTGAATTPAGATPTGTSTETPPAAVQTTPEAPPPDLTAPVNVLNGAGISGLASRMVAKLTTAGFTSVQANNFSGKTPVASTVFYATEDLRSTAELVGKTLGVTAYVMSPAEAGTAITVVLRTDPGA